MASQDDSAWKDILDARFEKFLGFFFPEIHSDVDWRRSIEPLDKELQPLLSGGHSQKRLADKLVKVKLKTGEPALILLHVEVQGSPESAFARRMYQYNYRIFERYGLEVVSLAVLTDSRSSFRPSRFHQRRWGFELSMTFPMVKLLDYESKRADLLASRNPFALVVLAHLESRQVRGGPPPEAYAVKWRLARLLYGRGYAKADIIPLYKFIDWVLRLPPELEQRMQTQVQRLEGKRPMPYVTHIEEMAIERGLAKGTAIGKEIGIEIGKWEGREEGRQEGRQEGLLEAIALGLKLRFGPAGTALLPRVKKVHDLKRLRAILAAIHKAKTLAEFRAQLSRR